MEYTEWNGNGENSDVPLTASRILATLSVFFLQEGVRETRLGALGIFELDDLNALDGLFAHPEQTGRDLGNYMVAVRYETVRETPSPVQVNVFHMAAYAL